MPGLRPTLAMAAAARRGLRHREKFGRGGTEAGVRRAQQLIERRELDAADVKSIHSYFARHDVDKTTKTHSWGSAPIPRRGSSPGDIGTNHAELVAAGNTLRLFLFDGADRPIPAVGATAQAVILAGGRQATITLAPGGDNMLVGTRDFSAVRGMRAVVTLTLPGQRPAQARFTPMDQN